MKYLELNKDWRVDVDADNYIIQRRVVRQKGKNIGQEVWRDVSYHGNLESLFSSLCENVTRENWFDLESILSEIRKIRDVITQFKKLT